MGQKGEVMKFLFGILTAAALVLISPTAQAQHTHGEEQKNEECRRGDYGCDHDAFHEIYRLLELISARTCCNNSEGRPTEEVIDATPDQRLQGYRFQAYVDGQWCPAKAESLLRFSLSQKDRLAKYKNSELLLRFYEYSHVFAPKSTMDGSGKLECPTIYCLWPKLPPF